jgi:small-conductance mechanosensitive channel
MNLEFLDLVYLGNTIRQYFYAIGAFFAILFALWVFKKIIVVKLKKIAKKTKTLLDDLLVKILSSAGWPIFYVLLSVYLALKFINSPAILDKIIYYVLLIIVVFLATKTIGNIIEYGAARMIDRSEKDNNNIDASIVQIISKTLKIIVWVVAILIVLSNLGYNVNALVAGLGIGGLAIAFAFQKILEDIFASISIYLDKPFKIGDFIVVGADSGTVKHIGIKSTRIETLQGQELVISNRELTSTRVNNYKKMKKRRIAFLFGVTYETPTEKLKKIPDMIMKIIDKIKITEVDRVHFKEFADSALNYEVVYYINSNEYGIYMDTQQEINLKIKESFEKEKIEMAYPTQTIFVKK